jgi:hypothetical protein
MIIKRLGLSVSLVAAGTLLSKNVLESVYYSFTPGLAEPTTKETQMNGRPATD